jgi:hypothetical protein
MCASTKYRPKGAHLDFNHQSPIINHQSPIFLAPFFLAASRAPAKFGKRPERTGFRVARTFFSFPFSVTKSLFFRIHGKYHPGRGSMG